MFSDRIRWGLEENELWQELSRRRASGERVLDLTESNPTRVGLRYPESEILQSLAQRETLRYEPSPRGLPVAREAVSEYYALHGVDVEADDIVLTASTSEAYSVLFKLLCKPGDRVLVPRPSYPLFDFLAPLDALRTASYRLSFDGTWRVDFDELVNDARDCRVVVAVHPNNPTGSYFSPEDGERLVEIAERNEVALVVDEVFLDYTLGRAGRASSFAGGKRGLVFVLSGLSKLAGLPQMKLAWIALAGTTSLRNEAAQRLDHINDTYLSVGAPVQHAARQLLELSPGIRDQIRNRTHANLDMLERLVEGAPAVSLLPLEGGWYATLRLPAVVSSEEWALDILKRASVYLHPGLFFGFPSEAYVVVSLITAPKLFQDAMGRVLRVVADRVDSFGG